MSIHHLTISDTGESVVPETEDDWHDWVSATRTRNHVLGDPLLDWLDLHGTPKGFNAAVLYERCFLLFEGITEGIALPVLYEIWSRSKWYLDGIRFVNAYNNDGVLRFTRFLRDQGREVIGLIDDDTTYNKGARRYLTDSSLSGDAHVQDVFKVSPVCFELAFSSSVWRRAIAHATEARGPQDATIDKHRASSAEFVNFLQERTGVQSKPELARHLVAAIRKPSDIPECIIDAFDAARKLAAPA